MYITYATRVKIFLIFMLVFILLLTLYQLRLQDQLSDHGVDLQAIEAELNQVKKENNLLHTDILEKSSLHVIEQKAKDNGFHKGVYFILK